MEWGVPKEKILANTWNVIFCFLRLFHSFLKAYLCKLIQIDLFGVLAENLGRRKFLETESNLPNFPAADDSPKMLADLILHWYGPLFAVDGPYVLHGLSSLLTDCYLQEGQLLSTVRTLFIGSVILGCKRLQKRALQLIQPDLSYAEALVALDITSLYERRQALSKALFDQIVRDQSHNFHELLPPRNGSTYCTRSQGYFRPDFFRLSFRNCISCVNNCEDLLYIYFFIPQFKYMNFIYS